MNDRALAELHLADLHARAAELGVEDYRRLRRSELLDAIAAREGDGEEPGAGPAEPLDEPEPVDTREEADERTEPAARSDEADTDEIDAVVAEGTVVDQADDAEAADTAPEGETEEVHGVLELTRQRYGFIRRAGLEPGPDDVYISASQVRRCELRAGDEVAGPARRPRRGERHPALVHVDRVNGAEPLAEARPEFDRLAPVLPERRVPLDRDSGDVLARAVDLLAPLALGQRVLVRAASRSGRTTLLRSVARATTAADARAIVLLIDERPEEATAWRSAVPSAEFAIATADFAPIEQVRVAELALERARRLAESGADVVLVCDSLSRLALAAGDAAEVKRLFGSGRNLAGGGSLTVVATTLADSRDEGEGERAVITTESSLITLDPELAAEGVYPALRPGECRVSNEDELRGPEELGAVRRLRSLLAELEPSQAAALLRERIEKTASSVELLARI
jgi:transcription termination factor Rho